MIDDYEEEFARYARERDEMAISTDLAVWRDFAKRNNAPFPEKDETASVVMHMCRTAIRGLPVEERRKSKQWLIERGHKSMDDGEI